MNIEFKDIGNIESNYSGFQCPDYLDDSEAPRRLNYEKIGNIEFDGIDYEDWPDFSNSYIVSADMGGIPMTEEELNELNENKGFVYMKLIDRLF